MLKSRQSELRRSVSSCSVTSVSQISTLPSSLQSLIYNVNALCRTTPPNMGNAVLCPTDSYSRSWERTASCQDGVRWILPKQRRMLQNGLTCLYWGQSRIVQSFDTFAEALIEAPTTATSFRRSLPTTETHGSPSCISLIMNGGRP